MKEDFTTAEVLKVTKIKKERLEVWIEKNFVRLPLAGGRGPGTRRRWSRSDIYGIELFKRLLGLGFSRDSADAFLKSLQRLGGGLMWGTSISMTPHSFLELRVIGKRISWNLLTDPRLEIDSSFDQIVVINMRKVVDDIDAKINELGD